MKTCIVRLLRLLTTIDHVLCVDVMITGLTRVMVVVSHRPFTKEMPKFVASVDKWMVDVSASTKTEVT